MKVPLKTQMIKQMIKGQGHSISSFAKVCGLGRSTLTSLLSGKISYDITSICKIAQSLQVSMFELFETKRL